MPGKLLRKYRRPQRADVDPLAIKPALQQAILEFCRLRQPFHDIKPDDTDQQCDGEGREAGGETLLVVALVAPAFPQGQRPIHLGIMTRFIAPGEPGRLGAMAAGVANKLWDMVDVVKMIDAWQMQRRAA